MHSQNLYVVTGPNAAGKSSFIRSRSNDFYQYEIIMTDVYKHVDTNFNENFKNIVYYHYYFDQAVFIYTEIKGNNETIMTLKALEIKNYRSNNYKFVAAFAQFAYQNDRLSVEAFKIISDDIDFNKEVSP